MSKLPKYFYFRVRATRHGTAIEVEDASDCDVVEVVRCKDCKWFGEIGCAIRIVDDSDKPKEDDYCSFAERRTDEAD